MANPSRRQLLQGLGCGVVALGCSDPESTAPGNAPAEGRGFVPSGIETEGAIGSATAWATGGTATMRGGYPDPFADGPGAACELTCAAEVGPCFAPGISRRDISERQAGVPMRLALLIVDQTCRSIEGAAVDIWHASRDGLYSGLEASAACTGGQAAAHAGRWFRGQQLTGPSGRVDFDSCFPGWYPGRTVHVHVRIRIGASLYVTSQLGFDDALSDDILATPPYAGRGARDTSNGGDNVLRAAPSRYVLFTSRMGDGALLAAKTLAIRATPGPGCRLG